MPFRASPKDPFPRPQRVHLMAARLGTSSWGERGWVGTFYPRGTPPGDFLTYYATRFDTVEADNTYYRVPAADLVRGWERKLPKGFTFCAKFPREIVHAGEGPRPDGERVLVDEHTRPVRDAFLERMGAMGAKLGPLLLQFPYFNRSAFAEPGPFLERLDRFLSDLPDSHRYAVEVRNRAWIGEPLLAILRSYSAALAWVDLPYLPHPAELARRFDVRTADFTYTRLIGDRKATNALTRTFSELVLDKSSELTRWAEFLRPAVAAPGEHFVFANNHYAGHGPATVRELEGLLGAGQPEGLSE